MAFTITAQEVERLLPGVKILQGLRPSGQKVVFKAERDGTIYALKIYDPASSLPRVLREIEVMTQLHSPYVARLEEFMLFIRTKQGQFVYSLEEFVEGEDLASKLSGGLVMDEPTLLKFLHAMLTGLITLKGANLIHRDIKPENIMIRPSGEPVIIDLGIAKHTEMHSLTASNVLGPRTPKYCAPEQLDPKGLVDFRTDLYALGIVAYVCATGKHPYWDDQLDPDENMRRMLSLPVPTVSGMSRETTRFVEKLMQRDHSTRFNRPELAIERLNENMGANNGP